jgi:hypothetical protein
MNQNNLIAGLFEYIESGEQLKSEEVILLLIKIASFNSIGDYQNDTYKQRIKDFKKGLSRFNKDLEKNLKEAEVIADERVAYFRKHLKKLATLPKFAIPQDTEKILKFINNLPNKDMFSISAAAGFLGNITRQTLARKIQDGYLNITFKYISKAPLISKEDLIRLYREANLTDKEYFGF